LASRGKAYPKEFWEKFLRFLDAELQGPADIVVIGGAAIGLHYATKHLTADLDSITSKRNRALWAAVERARDRMRVEEGLNEPPLISSTGVFDSPEDYESRLIQVPLKLRYLCVFVPERHDLALMKASRGEDRDFATLKAMHQVKRFRLKTLIERYHETLRVYVGDPWKLRLNFLTLIATLFGENAADRLEGTLRRS
jgi:hypothetical protein